MDIFRIIPFQIFALFVYLIEPTVPSIISDVNVEGLAKKIYLDEDGNEILEKVCYFEAVTLESHNCDVYLRPNERLSVKCSATANMDSSAVPVGITLQSDNSNVNFESTCKEEFCTAKFEYLPNKTHNNVTVNCYLKESTETVDPTHPNVENIFMYINVKLYDATLKNVIDDYTLYENKIFDVTLDDVTLRDINLATLEFGENILSTRTPGINDSKNSDDKSLTVDHTDDRVALEAKPNYNDCHCDFTNSERAEYKNKFYTGILHPKERFIYRCSNPTDKPEIVTFPRIQTNGYVMEQLENGRNVLKEIPLDDIRKGLARSEGLLMYDYFDDNLSKYNEIYLICHTTDVSTPVTKLSTLDGIIRIILAYSGVHLDEKTGVVNFSDFKIVASDEEESGNGKIGYYTITNDQPSTIFQCPSTETVKYKLLPERHNHVYYKMPQMEKNPFKNDKYNPQGDIGYAIAMKGISIIKNEDRITINKDGYSTLAYGMNPFVYFLCVVPKQKKENSLHNPAPDAVTEDGVEKVVQSIDDAETDKSPGEEDPIDDDSITEDWDRKYGAIIIGLSTYSNLRKFRICGPGYSSFDYNGVYIEDVDCNYSFNAPPISLSNSLIDSGIENEGSQIKSTVGIDSPEESKPVDKSDSKLVEDSDSSEQKEDSDSGIDSPIVQVCPMDKFNPNGPRCMTAQKGFMGMKRANFIKDFFEPVKDVLSVSSLWILEKERWETFEKSGVKSVTCLCYDSVGDVISKLVVNDFNSCSWFVTISLGCFASLLIFLL